MTPQVRAREGASVRHKCERHIVLTLREYEGGSRSNGPAKVFRTLLLGTVGSGYSKWAWVRQGCVLGSQPPPGAAQYEDSYTTDLLEDWTPVTHPEWGCLDVIYEPWFYQEVKTTHGIHGVFDHVFEDGRVQFMAAGAAVFATDIFLPYSLTPEDSVFYVPYTLEGMDVFKSRVWYQRLLLMPEWQRRSSIYLRECEPERVVAMPSFASSEFSEPSPPTWRQRAAGWLQAAADKLRGGNNE